MLYPCVTFLTTYHCVPGEYKGKVISEKAYSKLVRAGEESGYAWKTVTNTGTVLYLDGANYRTSNWLRFVNCARGQCEENVLVSSMNGNIVLYSYTAVQR